MFLGVKEMEVRKVRFEETFPPGEIDFSQTDAKQITPLEASGAAELLPNTDGELRIQGRLKVTMGAECDRCLAETRLSIDQAFDLFYKPGEELKDLEDEVAIDEGEAEIGFYENGGLELEQVLQEQILLLLPMQRVCREDCKGICPLCGKDRNQTDCHCETASSDDRWAALKTIAAE